jgi:dolichol-phosphate mannosyltransferase
LVSSQKSNGFIEPAAARAGSGSPVAVSVVTPIYNETGNIERLFDRLFASLEALSVRSEVIAVDDGSSDASLDELEAARRKHPALRVIELRRNFGQTAAMMAGIDHARGDVVITIDADLQNDPDDIPMLLDTLHAGGFDVVSGWRKDRKDAAIKRNLTSKCANWLVSRISGVKLHDYGCTLKAYRTEVLRHVRLYGEMHRFIPVYAAWMGAKVTEVPVRHHPRTVGKSKYGLERIVKVFLDMLVVKFLYSYMTKPIYIFGGAALAMAGMSAGCFVSMVALRLFWAVSFIQTPLPLMTSMLAMTAVMCLLMGVLAEIMIRTYYESQDRKPYIVRRLAGFGDSAARRDEDPAPTVEVTGAARERV